jgi:hypothetical protein
MSQTKETLFSVKGKTVFMILYNYSDCDYSIVKIMEKIEDAYHYICIQESKYDICKMIEVTKPEQIEEQFSNDYLNIYYISSGKYNKFNLCGYEAISYYAIVPMIID